MGSVKTNLGHSEAASGLTSVMKIAMALEKGYNSPTIGAKVLNPDLKLEERNIEIVCNGIAKPIYRASINSFGYGGANAHVILEKGNFHTSCPQLKDEIEGGSVDSNVLLPITGFDKASLHKRVQSLSSAAISPNNLRNLAYTLASRSTMLPARGYIVTNGQTLRKGLTSTKLRWKEPKKADKMPVAFVFTGQGAQWPNMGYDFYHHFPTFKASIDRLDFCLSKLEVPPQWSIKGNEHDMYWSLA